MFAVVYKIRDYQSKRAIERAHKELEQEAAKILQPFVDTAPSEMIPYGGTGIDGIWTDTDPA